jgi:hypothetical protein
MVVEPASAMELAGLHCFYKLDHCNHTDVCKPVTIGHPSYSKLLSALRTSREGRRTV